MAKRPIRSVIDRAREKGEDLDEFIAVPMFFETEAQRRGVRPSYIKTAGPHGVYYPIPEVDVKRVWYTTATIELDLNNGMHVSIETKPLTLAMHLTTAREDSSTGFVQAQLIPSDEHDASAATVQARIGSLRQVYAIACIAYGGIAYTGRLPENGLSQDSDFENYLPPNEHLLISSAGQGSFWATVGLKAIAAVKEAPKAALVAISVIFKDGPERIVRAAEAIVKTQEGSAEKTTAEARMTNAQASKAEAEAETAQAAANEAPAREALTTEKQSLELQKEKVDIYFEILEKINKIDDPVQRAALLDSLGRNSKDLLGTVAADLLQLPRRLS
jgi:hypothetical protein